MNDNDDDYQEVTEIGNCILSVNRRSDVRIECSEPVSKIDIDKTDIDLVSGVSNDVEKHADIIKKEEIKEK